MLMPASLGWLQAKFKPSWQACQRLLPKQRAESAQLLIMMTDRAVIVSFISPMPEIPYTYYRAQPIGASFPRYSRCTACCSAAERLSSLPENCCQRWLAALSRVSKYCKLSRSLATKLFPHSRTTSHTASKRLTVSGTSSSNEAEELSSSWLPLPASWKVCVLLQDCSSSSSTELNADHTCRTSSVGPNRFCLNRCKPTTPLCSVTKQQLL